MEYDFIVIGAGASGLTFSALMKKRGYRVLTLESHSLPGGCSSYFERNGYIFDAGATTLAGLEEGRPLDKLIKELDLKLDIRPVDPGIISVFGRTEIHRYKNEERWLSEVRQKFKDENIVNFFIKLKKINEEGWFLSRRFTKLPIYSLLDIKSFFSLDIFRAFFILPTLFLSVNQLIKSFKITQPNFLRYIDELLFITAQNKKEKTPLLMGSMGICYPNDTYYAMGGMKAFAETLASKCDEIQYLHKVNNVTLKNNGKDGFIVTTSKGVFEAKKLVSTIPIWNNLELFSDLKIKNIKAYEAEKCWSAYMIYLTVPLSTKRSSLYYQIHTDLIPFTDSHSFFVSFSHPDDNLRSINNRQTVTISCHTKTSQWENLTKEQYGIRKKTIEKSILKEFKNYFNLKDNEMEHILTGSPKTFFKYTRRHRGLVGGLPHSIDRINLKLILNQSPHKNLYFLGDTQFPGQGIGAVVLGAQNLAARF